MASNLRVDTILPSTGTSLGIGTASGTINFLGNSQINTTGVITATSFSGSGANLTSIPITSGVDNRVITASGANTIQGEANLILFVYPQNNYRLIYMTMLYLYSTKK